MTTAAQVRKLVQPLLDRNPDLALVGRWIYLTPIHHVARAVLIGRTSSADQFSPQWCVVHLFEPRRFFPLSWGNFLSNKTSPQWGIWRTSEPNIGNNLIEAIETQALPWLRTMDTIDLYLDFVSQNLNRHHLYDRSSAQIIVHVALGHIDAARKIWQKHHEEWSVENPNYDDEDREKYRRLRELGAYLDANDRAGLARLLHAWEAETVKNFKIERIWEPTPFPLEQQSAI